MTFSWLVLLPADTYAYIGPGAGLAAIGTLIALIAAVIFTIVGFVWYPIKRLLKTFGIGSARRDEGEKASSS
jgi:amino acid transporter